jgi:TonB family protein
VKHRGAMGQSVLNRSVVVSLVVHSGLVGLLLLLAGPPVSLDKPIQVRFVEPPPVAAPPSSPQPAPQPIPQPRLQPAPQPPPSPAARRGSSERESRGERLGRPEGSGISAVPRLPQDVPAPPSPPPQPARPVPETPPPPQVAARPTPEPVPPAVEPRRELREERPPERSGLSLSGPPRDVVLPPPTTAPARPTRPSLRDQIAGLGSGLSADTGGPAKQTISLDDRRPRFMDYLARLKQRIMAEWTYPEDAQRVGVSGDLEIVFTLNPAGTLIYIQLTRSSGFPVLDNEALRALKTAAPYDAFPSQMGAESVNIVGHFIYPSAYRYRRN